MLKRHEINNLTLSEIKIRLHDSQEALSNLKFQLTTHQLDDTSKVRQTRREVARLKTILQEIAVGKRKALSPSEKKEVSE
jgi:large subunit ribosomal protein L29